MSQHILINEEETKAFAKVFSKKINNGDIICLWGDLGAGKSVFCRSLIQELCNNSDQEVPSPTFTLVQQYESTKGLIWHFDLYRLTDPEDVYEIGWEEAMVGGIILIEWPSRLGFLLPQQRIDVKLDVVPHHPDQRKISVKTHGI